MAQTPSVFIQIWVDTNALQNGSTKGVYVVDNRVSNGSQNEGTASLTTNASNGSTVNWQIFNIDPTNTGTIGIQSISNSNAWGSGGQPQADPTYGGFSGQVQNTGTAQYSVTFNAQKQPGSAAITTTINLAMSVH
jgi:hypothetical protein